MLKFYFGENVREIGCLTFEDVFSIVEYGKVKYGVLPVENSSTGGIVQVYDLLDQYDVYIVGEQQMLIEHNLLGLPGTDIAHIKTSTPMSSRRSSNARIFLAEHKDMEHTLFHTAVSANLLRGQGIPPTRDRPQICGKAVRAGGACTRNISTAKTNTTQVHKNIRAKGSFLTNADKAHRKLCAGAQERPRAQC